MLPSDPESAKAAREFTTTTLRDWRLDSVVHEAVIIASELVTNAIRHGTGLATYGSDAADTGQVELAWQRQPSRIVCIVTDGSDKPPVLAPSELDAEGGRGLQVIQAIAAGWGWMMLGTAHKAVWAALQITRGC